jgi:dTDP-4-dehydrorhamnose reductase
LIYGGKTGYIGQKLVKLFKEAGHNSICATSRLENREEIIREILTIKPDHIINAAGITGRPNIDWCEDHKQERHYVVMFWGH